MKVSYYPETDSLSIKLRTGEAGVVGEIMGEDLNENVVLHRDDAGTLYEIEVVGSASKVFDLSRLEVRTSCRCLSRFPAREQGRLSIRNSIRAISGDLHSADRSRRRSSLPPA